MGTDEQQLITISGNPNGGDYLLGFLDEWILAPLRYNANAADMTAALTTLSTVGAGNLTVAKRPTGALYDVFFVNNLGQQDVPLISVDYSNLNRGSITVSVVTEGVSGITPPDPEFPAAVTLPVLVAPSARDYTRDYMLAQLAERGITAPWSTGIPADRPDRFFTIEELNSATTYGIFADAQLLQIRGYDSDRKWLGEVMRLVKGLWKVMPAELLVQDVEHAGGPLYDRDPDVPSLYYGQVIAWVSVMNQLV